MVNTLWNTSEKVTSTPRGSSSSALKKIVAAAIALTLSGQPAEAKTYNKQEFPTEMVANVPWEISPITENVEQTNIPNYIDQAQKAVKKYYPQYEEYFKTIFKEINKIDKEYINVINNNLDKIAKNTKIWTSEKDIYTTILMTLEKLVWKSAFCNDEIVEKNIEEKDFKEWAAKAIVHSIKKWLEKRKNELEIIMEKWKKMTERMETIWNKSNLTREDEEELLNIIEDIYNLIENTEAIKDKRNKPIFEEYLKRCKDLWRTPNETTKKIIKWLNDN